MCTRCSRNILQQFDKLNDLRVFQQIIHAHLGLIARQFNALRVHGVYVLPSFLATNWMANQFDWLFSKVCKIFNNLAIKIKCSMMKI